MTEEPQPPSSGSTGPDPDLSRSDADEFDAFYRAEFGRLAGTLRLLSGGSMIADDVAQESFVRAWVRWDRVGRLDRPAGWVYVTAFRLLGRRLGREGRRPAIERSAAPLVGEVGTGRVGDLTDRLALERALASLPLRERQAVVARHVLGYDGPEAAALLGMRPDAFRQLLSRTLRDLRVSPELLEAT